MPIKSQYEQRITAHIESNPRCNTGRIQRIEIEGKLEELPIYRLPIKLLVFNVENGRFAADLNNLELKFKRGLDARNAEDAKEIEQILFDKSAHDTKLFYDDLKRRGQVEPGVITAAGVVINANRRMAILSKLHKDTGEDKYAYLDVSILPRSISDAEIYKIEARLQYAKDFKQGFGAVNELLKIRDGLKYMSKEQLCALLARTEKYIDEAIEQLKLLELFSKKAWGKIDYSRIEKENITEHITDVLNNIKKFKNEGRRPAEIKKILDIQFAYIKSGCSHLDVRKIGKYAALDKIEESYDTALDKLTSGKMSEPIFRETIDALNDKGWAIIKKGKPAEIASLILEEVKEFQDKQFKITPEIKKYFKEISKIITKLLK